MNFLKQATAINIGNDIVQTTFLVVLLYYTIFEINVYLNLLR